MRNGDVVWVHKLGALMSVLPLWRNWIRLTIRSKTQQSIHINFKDLSKSVSVLKGETDVLGLNINLCLQ